MWSFITKEPREGLHHALPSDMYPAGALFELVPVPGMRAEGFAF